MVLRHHVANPAVCQTSMKLRHCQVCGHSSRVSVCWSVITEVSTTNTNGSTKKSATAMARECTATQCSASRRRCEAAAELTVIVAMSVLTQEAGAATQQDHGEDHAQREQHQRDDTGGADVEPLEAEVVNQLRQRER